MKYPGLNKTWFYKEKEIPEIDRIAEHFRQLYEHLEGYLHNNEAKQECLEYIYDARNKALESLREAVAFMAARTDGG